MDKGARRGLAVLTAAALFCAADLMLKSRVRVLPEGAVRAFLPGICEIVHTANDGYAFGMLSGFAGAALLQGFAVLLLLALETVMRNRWMGSVPLCIAVILLDGGALGNLLDRLLHGRVTDYLRLMFIRFPVFNLADIGVTAGALMLLVSVLAWKAD